MPSRFFEPSQVLKSGLAYTPQFSLLYVRIGEIIDIEYFVETVAYGIYARVVKSHSFAALTRSISDTKTKSA